MPTVNLLLDAETGVAGDIITPANLAAGSHVTPSSGIWKTTPTTLMSLKISDAPLGELPNPVIIDGVTYPTAGGTRGVKYELTLQPPEVPSGQKVKELANFALSAARPRVSAGMFFKFFNTPTAYVYYDMLSIPGYKADAVLQVRSHPTAPFAQAHSILNGGSYQGADIPIQYNKVYWAEMLADYPAGLATVALYDPLTWTQVGPLSTSPLDATKLAKNVMLGADPHRIPTAGAEIQFDNLIADWTTAAFPLWGAA